MSGQNSSHDETRRFAEGTCNYCGKVSWRDRKAARKVARQRSLCVYVCQLRPEWAGERWHVGNPPADLKAGAIARSDVHATSTHRLR